MPDFVHIRPAKQPEGMRPLVVYLYDGRLLPPEGRRVIVDRHVRMLIATGDVEEFEAPAEESSAQPEATADQTTKSHRKAARVEEPS